MGGVSVLGTSALSASIFGRAAQASPLASLEIWGPPAGPSIVVLHAIATGRLDSAVRKPSLGVWRQVDEVRAGLTSKSFDVGIVPVPVAANLYNRGLGVRLVTVMTNGILYIMSSDPALTTFESLKGRKLAVLFPNEMPSLLLERLGEPAVKVVREWRGISQEELADRSGVAITQIARAERQMDTSPAVLRCLARALRVRDELLVN